MTEKRKPRFTLTIKVTKCSHENCPFHYAVAETFDDEFVPYCMLAKRAIIFHGDMTRRSESIESIPDWCKLRDTPAYVYVDKEMKNDPSRD